MEKDEVLRVIAEAVGNKQIELNLSGNQLERLPEGIVELKNLTTLNLSVNQLKTLPAEIGELKNLTTFFLSWNQLKTLPAEIAELKNLTTLDLSQNQLKTMPAEIAELKNLTSLGLSGNPLKTLPAEIAELKNLTKLDLSGNQLKTLPAEIAELTNLTELDLSVNQLETMPAEIGKLKNLTLLDLSINQLKTMPAEIAELKNLTELHLPVNQLKTMPAEIAELKNLTLLDLSQNQLKTLPAEIVELKNLTSLHLSHNQLERLPAEIVEIAELKNLTTLHLSGNQLKTLPAEIAELKNLTSLYLYRNQLKTLPTEIAELKNLTKLHLSHNQLERLPAEIVELTNLTELELSGNQLKTLPAEIVELKNLTVLGLSGNQLKTLPAEIVELTNLTKLNLSENQLERLPAEIVELTNLTELNLSENPLESPPLEIAEQGIDAIFEYLRQLPEEAIEHNEAKMILVGHGDVGKTCLAKRLIYDKFIEDKSTEGIDILKWDITAPTADEEEIKLNVWDFGGQEIYHATHQFFLTKRSLYLLVWNARKSQDYEHIYYWLHTIDAFGEDSPIVLVLSKRNERDDDLNMKELKEKFPQIIDLYKIDSKDGKGIRALKDIISETAWHLPHMRTPWIASWYNVRERLEHDRREWIGYTEFKQICESEGLDKKQTDILDEYLHVLGVVIHFRDRLELRDMVILKPEWATKVVYNILDTHSILDRGGILLHSELDQIWDTDIYPPDIFPKLLGLMNKFELVYELPDKKSHLVAELLPKTEPEFGWDETNNLRFYYRYDFLPAGVITRFIVLMHEDLKDKPDGTQLCWREGAVLQREGTRALVKVKPLEKRIEIKINGSRKRELLAIIRNQFDHINRSIKKVKITEEIPCNCSEGCAHKFDYIQLLNAENVGKNTVDCPVSWKGVQLSALLDGFVKKEERKEEYENRSKDGKVVFLNIEQKQGNIIQKQEVKQDVMQDVKQDVKQEVKINLKIDLPAIQSEFCEFKREVTKLDEELDEELVDLEDDLLEITPASGEGKVNKAINKLSLFMKKLKDEDSKFSRIVKGTKKGIELAQKLAVAYNKFAQPLGLDSVQDLFL